MFAFSTRSGRATRRRRPSARPVSPESLEARLALSATASAVVLDSAAAVDSHAVEVRYTADPTAASRPLRLGVYRSADETFDPSDEAVTTFEVPASARTPGEHALTIPVADGLPIDVARPHVLIVADPDSPGAATDPARTASFRKFSIGVVTHGGIINKSWSNGSPWQLQIGRLMEQEGYDAVIPFNWVNESSQPGHAAPQGIKLARQIERLLERMPDDAVSDLHMIGHSQGTVVNAVALRKLAEDAPPELRGGWIKSTLLDPHPANNHVPGQLDSSLTALGGLARMVVEDYQARAKDPNLSVPPSVDETEVFYQHTHVRDIHLMSPGGYNLWGQVPIANPGDAPIHYYNLTQANATHSGASGVAHWYRNFVATTLAEGAPLIRALRLDGAPTNAVPTSWEPDIPLFRQAAENWGPDMVVDGARPSFSGTAAPGATVRVYVGPTSDLSTIRVLDVVTADDSGAWTVTADRDLAEGRHRAIAMAYSPEHHTRPAFAIVSMAPMGRFWIGGDPRV
ncbi:hypothetical protein [Paludisphaera sp.]|uniref:hypothetical protein n=1 Tax=Paludisphaera sp. TaxID=2017432 RepID=UPI00301DA4B8